MRRASALATAIAAAATLAAPAAASTTQEVDPFIGVDAGGNTTPGAQVPFGFANPGPDTAHPDSSGYASGQPLLGFSQTHVSGTGGAGKYGNFRVLPEVGPLDLSPAPQPLTGERAGPGWYAAGAGGVRVELTAARLAAYHRYSFPGGAPGWLLIDAGSVVSFTPQHQRAHGAFARVTGPRSFEGGVHVTGGWGLGGYRLYFAARLDGRPQVLGVRRGRLVYAGFGSGARRVGLRMGLSFRSTRAARRNLRGLGSFHATRAAAQAAWQGVLGKIGVTGGTAEQRRMFATALYHANVMPHDLSGDNAWWRSREPHYEDFFTLWDTFRTVNPLLALVEPKRESGLVRSLVDTYRHTGWLPDGRVAGNTGLTQVGSSADVVIADAAVKGIGGIDYATAYRAVRKDAEVDSRRPYARGRQLVPYKRLGYVPLGQRASASRTLEYAYGDFAASELAAALGKRADASRYRARSRGWRRLWDPATQAIRPRHRDGRFLEPFDPNRFYAGWHDPFYEGTPLQWSTFVPHDAAALIARIGGDDAAVRWLDRLFAARYGPVNEPAMLAPFLYSHAGRPDLAAKQVAGQRDGDYSAGRAGLPGNDDSGALSAWYVWAAIGLYPNAGQPWYYIGSPLFDRVHIRLPGGRAFTIVRSGRPGAAVVTAALLDHRPLRRAWLTHREVARGGTLELTMGDAPSGWGTGSRPPSPAGLGGTRASWTLPVRRSRSS
ncbi:MAG: hypothetical protein QOF37_71 [Thermoleophilaceae bacterium]|nr:hypothetical protein [Thermoleophilaceae bacterium]